MMTKWIQLNGQYYYLDPATGKMAANTTLTIDGTQYTFNSSGVCQNAGGVSAQSPGSNNNNSPSGGSGSSSGPGGSGSSGSSGNNSVSYNGPGSSGSSNNNSPSGSSGGPTSGGSSNSPSNQNDVLEPGRTDGPR